MELIMSIVVSCWLFFVPAETPGCHYHADGKMHCGDHLGKG